MATSPLDSFANIDIEDTVTSIKEAGIEVKKLAETMNRVLGDGTVITDIAQNADSALKSIERTMTSFDQVLNIVGDPETQQNLRRSVARVPEMFDAVEGTLQEMDRTLIEYKTVATQAQRMIINITEITELFKGEQGQQMIADLAGSLDNIQMATENLRTLTSAIDSKEGTIGMLVHDRELYDRVNRTLREFERITQRVQPIINDVRILTDRLARDPGGEIGLKSLFDQRPSGSRQKIPLYSNPPTTVIPQHHVGDGSRASIR